MLLTDPLNDADITRIFADAQLIAHCTHVEATLARAQAHCGLVPDEAATAIEAAAHTFSPDLAAIHAAMHNDGFPIIELVRQLRAATPAPHGEWLHFGATTQDILDSALALQLQQVIAQLRRDLARLMRALGTLARAHATTVMCGRTHAQQAVPITFGLKVAGWLAPLLRHNQRLSELEPRVCMAQLGGAAGTLAPLFEHGTPNGLATAFAQMLGLHAPVMPWHTQRDGVAEFAGWLSLLTGSLAKIAQDVILLAQSEVGEVSEGGGAGRGGSSTMPQKRNPIASELIVTAARANAQHLAAMHAALIQEHERGTHGWQLEWLALPAMCSLTASALRRSIWLIENLEVDVARMQKNVLDSNGLMLAERLSFALAGVVGRAKAKALLGAASVQAQRENRHIVDVLREQIDAPVNWKALRDERGYVGNSVALVEAMVQQAERDGAVMPAFADIHTSHKQQS